MEEHIWVTRVYCPGCDQYSWSNPGSGTVLCRCTGAEIRHDVIIRGQEVIDEVAFRAAVVMETGIPNELLDLRQG